MMNVKKEFLRCFLTLAFGAQVFAGPYLGVETTKVHDAVSAQLGLDDNVGLQIKAVDEDSPAGVMLKKHDVLHKFQGEVLTSHKHLLALMANHKSGDEVQLEVIRKGQSINMTLVLADAPARAAKPKRDPNDPFAGLLGEANGGLVIPPGEGFEKIVELMQQQIGQQLELHLENRPGGNPQMFKFQIGPGGPKGGVKVKSSSKVIISQNGFNLTLTEEDGKRHLQAVDENGDEVFNGDVNTEEEIENLPPRIKEIYDTMGKNMKFEFKGEFQPHPLDDELAPAPPPAKPNRIEL